MWQNFVFEPPSFILRTCLVAFHGALHPTTQLVHVDHLAADFLVSKFETLGRVGVAVAIAADLEVADPGVLHGRHGCGHGREGHDGQDEFLGTVSHGSYNHDVCTHSRGQHDEGADRKACDDLAAQPAPARNIYTCLELCISSKACPWGCIMYKKYQLGDLPRSFQCGCGIGTGPLRAGSSREAGPSPSTGLPEFRSSKMAFYDLKVLATNTNTVRACIWPSNDSARES